MVPTGPPPRGLRPQQATQGSTSLPGLAEEAPGCPLALHLGPFDPSKLPRGPPLSLDLQYRPQGAPWPSPYVPLTPASYPGPHLAPWTWSRGPRVPIGPPPRDLCPQQATQGPTYLPGLAVES